MTVKSAQEEQLDLERRIYDAIESAIEDTNFADRVATYADTRAGKPVTIKDEPQLRALTNPSVRISKCFGSTYIQPCPNTAGIRIAQSDTNVRWPTAAELRASQPAFYGARDERNKKRRQLLREHAVFRSEIGDRGVPDNFGKSLIYRAAYAIRQLEAARRELQRLVEIGETMDVARFDIEKIIGKGIL